MTKTAATKSPQRKGRMLLALLATTAAFAGAQALLPASAAALDDTGPKCTSGIDLIFIEACVEDRNGGGGVSGGIGDPDPTGSGAEPPAGGAPVAGGGIGDPGPPEPGDDSTGSQAQSQTATPPAKRGISNYLWPAYAEWKQRRECRATYRSIKQRIRYRYGGADIDFDRVTNTTDKPLAELQTEWDANGCAGALHVGI